MLLDAFRFLCYDKAKTLGILFGIVLSVFLIGQQVGICLSLLSGIVSLASNNARYIWVVSNKTEQVGDLPALDTRIGRELMSVHGVKKVHPLVVAAGSARFENGSKAALTLIGTQAPAFAGGPWNLAKGNPSDLLQEGAVIADEYDGASLNNIQIGDRFEINGHRVVLVGQTRGARGLGLAYAFTSLERARKLGRVPLQEASAFLVEWKAGVSAGQVVRAINGEIPGVKAWEGQNFVDNTLAYAARTSGIVASFGLLVAFALLTGLAIVSLTMYSAVNDRIRDYGTVKAIGGSNGVIRKLILLQAAIYSTIGFWIAFSLLWVFVQATKTVLNIQLTPAMGLGLVGVTLSIALMSSWFAMRRVIRLEPVQIFKL